MKTFLDHTKILALLILSIFVSCSDDNSTENISYTDAQTFFDELNFKGAVLISKNGIDILRQGFGFADRSTQEVNTPETRFRIGSVSKTFTGMGIIQLQRDGLIESLEQPLSDFDADFPQTEQITIKDLLTHQSGIPDYLSAVEANAKQGQTVDPEDIYELLAERIENDGLNFMPGTKFEYSNSNFLIAALLIEELSGGSYEDYIQANVLNPLEMNNTEPGTNDITEVGYAHGYRTNHDVSSYPMTITLGAGNWTSTIEDLEKWCQAAMSTHWFTAEEKEAIFGGEIPLNNTALGLAWFKSNINGKRFFWHSGTIDGFSAIIGFLPDTNGILITLSNEEDITGSIQQKTLETILSNEF